MFNYNHTPYTLPSALDSIIFREQNSHLCVAIVIKCASLNFYVLQFNSDALNKCCSDHLLHRNYIEWKLACANFRDSTIFPPFLC